ncbi:MAG: glutamate--tRNA ligase family protein [Chitinophagales bacterium]
MIRSRLAPTPSGFLHIGNAFNFLLTQQLVRRQNGILRLRIDDRDMPRFRQEYLEDIFESLHWLEIVWDEGPQHAEDERLHFSQELQTARYDALLSQLVLTGKVFACNCSRKTMHAMACSCREKQLPLHTPDVAWRVATPADDVLVQDQKRGDVFISLEREMKDFIVRRRDGIPAYQVVSLADDLTHQINFIVRGEDLLPSTAAQLYLAELIGANSFSETQFLHHPLLTDSHGEKLSKSSGAPSLQMMRRSGITKKEILVQLEPLLAAW